MKSILISLALVGLDLAVPAENPTPFQGDIPDMCLKEGQGNF